MVGRKKEYPYAVVVFGVGASVAADHPVGLLRVEGVLASRFPDLLAQAAIESGQTK
jgi:hypothetical protein